MIYDAVPEAEPVAQGDIFANIPRITCSLSDLTLIDDEEDPRSTTWRETVLAGRTDVPLTALLPIQPVMAIVITQNCDALRGESLSLCEIRDYLKVMNQQTPPANPKKWEKLIVERSRTNCRVFYLPESKGFGIDGRKAVDFRIVLPVRRLDLEDMRDQRIGRLNSVAAEHFRESIAHFFRRYAVNEWYPLTPEEFAEYSADQSEAVAPYPWQEG